MLAARQVVGGDRFLSVYLSAPVEVCRQRDRTGAYQLADEGKIAQFPGVSAVFEEPRHVDLELATDRVPVAESVDRILAPGRFTRDALQAQGITRPITILPNFVPAGFDALAAAPEPLPRPEFLYVGRVTESAVTARMRCRRSGRL